MILKIQNGTRFMGLVCGFKNNISKRNISKRNISNLLKICVLIDLLIDLLIDHDASFVALQWY